MTCCWTAKLPKMPLLLLLLCSLLSLVPLAHGHGMMLQPPGRSSRWRYDSSAPPNYNDNALFCGGYAVQWNTHGGKCGFCGDDYGLARPRPNELGGQFGGSGTIVAQYKSGAIITATVHITANHLGHIQFDLCNLDAYGGAESDACYNQYRLQLDDGSTQRSIGTFVGQMQVGVRLPAGVSCSRCVLRWTHVTGNNWGVCANGSGAMGCGPQENFRSCADIRISATRELVDLPED